MIGKRLRSLPFIFANDNYTLSFAFSVPVFGCVDGISAKRALQAVRRSLRGTERVTAPPDV